LITVICDGVNPFKLIKFSMLALPLAFMYVCKHKLHAIKHTTCGPSW